MRAAALAILLSISAVGQSGSPLRLAIAGLVHDHARGFLGSAKDRTDVQIVGISDPNPELRRKYARRFSLPDSIFFADTSAMLDATRPEAVAIFTSTYDHPAAVESAAAHRLPTMMEKPLAVNLDHARRIEQAARRSGIPVIVNYETTWYRSHAEMWRLFHEQKTGGAIRRMVAMDGHEGPKEIGVQQEFFAWLTDRVRNGAGALFDFGCYGANLMTWMLDNQRPLAVTALTRTNKPSIYPQVDDEATVLVQYPGAQGVIEASWNWPFNRKDFEVYTEHAYAVATGGNSLRLRRPGAAAEEMAKLADLPQEQRDPIAYLAAVARRKIAPSGLSSLENNLIVTEILDAARESARSGHTVVLH